MKKNLLLISICFIIFFLPAADRSLFSYLGSFKCDELQAGGKAPSLSVYYKGARIPVEKGSYIFSDPQRFSTITFVIALLDKPKANTITHFSVPKNKPYLLVQATRKTKQFALKKGEVFEEQWTIVKTEGIGPFTIPEQAIVILIDPTCIEMIKNVTWKRDSFVTTLPTIVFKKDVTTSDAYAQSLFADLDVRLFHKESDLVVNKQTKTSESSKRLIV